MTWQDYWEMSEETVNPHEKLLQLLQINDARDALERATAWVVVCYHLDARRATELLLGPFETPAAALEFAARHEAEMKEDGDTRWVCSVLPIMPAL